MPPERPRHALNSDQADTPEHPPVSRGRFVVVRLAPGEDLITGLHRARGQANAVAAAVVTCVGSLTRVVIRHANRPQGTPYLGHFEITSLVGTVEAGGEHLHLTISDGEGRVSGGHLLPGSSVYTTAEIALVLFDDITFHREPCALSGYSELVVRSRE